MGAIISALGAFLSNASVLRFLATKALLYSLLVVVFPVIMWNLGIEWASYLIDLIVSNIPAGSYVGNVTGLGAWLLDRLNVPQAIEIVVAAAISRMLIRVLIR